MCQFNSLVRISFVALASVSLIQGCRSASRGGDAGNQNANDNSNVNGNGNANDNSANVIDRSDFREFRFEQGPSIYSCVIPDSVFQASIDRQDDATYTLDLSVIEEGQRGVDACRDDLTTTVADCIVVQELPTRSLTAAEAQQVRQVFSTIGFEDRYPCEDPPCRIYTLRWDDDEFAAAFVNTLFSSIPGCIALSVERLDRNDFSEIAALLEDLREVE